MHNGQTAQSHIGVQQRAQAARVPPIEAERTIEGNDQSAQHSIFQDMATKTWVARYKELSYALPIVRDCQAQRSLREELAQIWELIMEPVQHSNLQHVSSSSLLDQWHNSLAEEIMRLWEHLTGVEQESVRWVLHRMHRALSQCSQMDDHSITLHLTVSQELFLVGQHTHSADILPFARCRNTGTAALLSSVLCASVCLPDLLYLYCADDQRRTAWGRSWL